MSQDEKLARRAGLALRTKGPRHVRIGFEPRQLEAYSVAHRSLRQTAFKNEQGEPAFIDSIKPIILADLRAAGMYQREVAHDEKGRLFDPISGAGMSTEFAISRFFAMALAMEEPYKRRPGFTAKDRGWVLFMDCDMLVREPIDRLFAECEANPQKAIMCVQHRHVPLTDTKMDDQLQLTYMRKNWSSVMALNLDHEANGKLTTDLVNEEPGRNLHRFCWLEDDLIGALHPKWNWLVGYSPELPSPGPAIVHWTEGGPWLAWAQPEFRGLPYENEWLEYVWHK